MEAKNGWNAHYLCDIGKLFNTEKMITLIIKLAQAQEWYGVSDMVEIAKGKNQYAQSWGQVKNTYKRKYKSWRKK